MPSTKTLRVTLADIIGPTGVAVTGSTAVVHARYVDTSGRGRDVHLTDGTIVVPVRRVASPDGDPEVFDFDVYANDVAPVREVDYGHLVEVSWTVVAPTGAKSSGVKRVQVTDDMDAVVQLGLLVTPDPIPGYTGGYVTPETYATLVERMDVFEVGGPVWSVNGENGVVVLDAADVGAATTAQGAKADTAVQPARTVTAGTGLTGGGDLSADRTLAVAYGTTAGTAAQGNDSRLAAAATAVQLQPTVPRVPAAAVAIQSPTDISSSGVHPDVVDAGVGKWNGWRYWMIYTPYWRSAARYENPCVLVSDDGQNWVEPAGIVNPIDPKPAAALNSDPDMVLVGGTMYAYYRQHDPVSKTEQIMLRTSTDGITWSAEQTVLDTTGTSPTDRMNLISPAVVHTGAQFVMYYSKFSVINRRTSADGVTWSAEASVTGVASPVAHIDATRGSDGRTHLFMQMSSDAATTESGFGSQIIQVAKSTDGIAFSVGATPLLVSEHMAQRMVYRTCGLVEARNGKDYYRLWASCVSLGLSETAASVAAGNVESYYIGYTEGYDPNDPAPQDKTSLYPPGDVIAGGTVRGKRMGALSIWGRFVVGVRAAFDKLRAQELRAGLAYIDGGNYEASQTVVPPEWAARLGYTIGQQTPSLTVGSRTDTQAADAIIALHNTSPGNTRAAAEGWHISVNSNGHLHIHQRAADGTRTSRGFLAYESGDMVWNRRGYFLSVGTTESITAGQKIIISGNALQINTASTPSSSSNAPGTVGEIRRDENYIYVMTSVGWKRAALSTW